MSSARVSAELRAWVDSFAEIAERMSGWAYPGMPYTDVKAVIEPDSNGVQRAYWRITRGRFTARLELEACNCREIFERPFVVCTKLEPLPKACFSAHHCHAWHPEKIAAYVLEINKKPRAWRPKPLARVSYRESTWSTGKYAR